MSMQNAFFELEIPGGPRKKVEKGVVAMPAIDCGHRLYRLCRHHPPGFAETGHSGTVRSGHHLTTGIAQTAQRLAAWATSASGSLKPVRPQSRNLMKIHWKAYYDHQCRQGTRENMSP